MIFLSINILMAFFLSYPHIYITKPTTILLGLFLNSFKMIFYKHTKSNLLCSSFSFYCVKIYKGFKKEHGNNVNIYYYYLLMMTISKCSNKRRVIVKIHYLVQSVILYCSVFPKEGWIELVFQVLE